MPDVITCTAVLTVNPPWPPSDKRSDYLFLTAGKPDDFRNIPVRPKGHPRRGDGQPEWEYEIRGDRLHLEPSLLCVDTQFHTAYHWECAFSVRPEGVDSMTHYFALNGRPPGWEQ